MKQLIMYMGVMLLMATGLFIVYYNSGRFSNTYAEIYDEMEQRNASTFQNEEKVERLDSGKWYSNSTDLYNTISFETNDSAIISNHPDTIGQYLIFLFKYALKKDILWLIDEKDSIRNTIKRHNNQELIFESFLSEKKEMKYSRVKTQQ